MEIKTTDCSTKIPANPNEKLWRYLDIWKFIDLLSSNELHFTRADIIKKKYEHLDGKYPDKIYDLLKKECLKHFTDSNYAQMEASIWWKIPEIMDRISFINCWNVSPQENAAMWKIYTNNNQGIAIQTTFNKLINSIKNKKIIPGLVNYIDHKTLKFENGNTLYSTGNAFYHCFLKHISFSYEKELRLVYWSHDKKYIKHSDISIIGSKGSRGYDIREFVRIPITDFNYLIENIYASPFLESWQITILDLLLNKFNINKKIIQSELSQKEISNDNII